MSLNLFIKKQSQLETYLKSEFLTNVLPRNTGKVGLKRTESGTQKRMRIHSHFKRHSAWQLTCENGPRQYLMPHIKPLYLQYFVFFKTSCFDKTKNVSSEK